MKKLISGIALTAMFALPLVAGAATVTSNAVFNGQTQVYGNAGQSVQATFQVDIPAGQVLHAIRTKVDSQATICTAIGPFEGAQTVDTNVNITLPPNTNSGGYSLIADLYYTDTLPQAEAMTGDLACTSAVGGSHVNMGAYNAGTVVNVLPTSGGTTGSSSNGIPAWFTAWWNAQHPTAPAPSSACASLNSKLSGTIDNTYNDANARLQGFLISEGIDIPAIRAGASYGYKGPQTRAGVASFQVSNHCQ